MTEQIYLLLGVTPSEPLTWMRVDEQGGLRSHGLNVSYQDFAKADIYTGTEKLIALLPGEYTTLRLLPAPPRGRGQLLLAAQYLLEDSLGEDIDKLHVATALRSDTLLNVNSDQDTDQSVIEVGSSESTEGTASTGIQKTQTVQRGLCLAVSKTILDPWARIFSQTDTFPDLFTADFMALSIAPMAQTRKGETPVKSAHSNLTLFAHQDGLIAHGLEGGFAIDMHTANEVLDDILERWDAGTISLFCDAGQRGDLAIKGPGQVTHHPTADLATLASLYFRGTQNTRALPNFISGVYARKTNWGALIAPWRNIAIAASLCVAAFLANWLFEGIRADRSAERFASLSHEIHDTAFPGKASSDPVSHARQILGARSASIKFLTVWNSIGVALEGETGLQIDSIFYAGPGQDLRLSINMDSIETLESFRTKLNDLGFSSEDGRLNQTRPGQWTGELRVKL